MQPRVLVVDDEEDIRDLFQAILEDEGMSVVCSNNYMQAIAAFEQNSFDLVCTDITLGGKSGLDFLKEIRKRGSAVHVLVITGFPNLGSAQEAIRSGAFDYLSKPVRNAEFLQRVKNALDHKKNQR